MILVMMMESGVSSKKFTSYISRLFLILFTSLEAASRHRILIQKFEPSLENICEVYLEFSRVWTVELAYMSAIKQWVTLFSISQQDSFHEINFWKNSYHHHLL